ncbi:hypothetical protein ACGFR6_06285 [Streptomyces sp. NPDC048567]|uniref:hypothetical protein n=1 Tax=Streptomyces sp. NPDC048567 TaxID=3365570 RepID=UPI00371EFD90
MVQKPESGIESKERRIDLSLPQVAGSAVAAVAAAVAASQLGVYGTIAGAGVMSVVATCGGSVFQHFFRRTGEQIREVTVQVKHPDREVTVYTRETGARRPEPSPQETVLLGAVDDATTVLRRADPRPDETMLLRRADPDEEFSEATTHGTRLRGWKRSAIGAAVVFAVSMAGITTYELISGDDLSGGHGTTVGSVVRGGHGSGSSTPGPAETTGPGQDGTNPGRQDESGTATPGTGGRDEDGTAPRPDRSGAPTEGATPTPTPSDPAGGGVEPTPTPSPSATDGGGESATPDPTATDGAPAPAGTGAGE